MCQKSSQPRLSASGEPRPTPSPAQLLDTDSGDDPTRPAAGGAPDPARLDAAPPSTPCSLPGWPRSAGLFIDHLHGPGPFGPVGNMEIAYLLLAPVRTVIPHGFSLGRFPGASATPLPLPQPVPSATRISRPIPPPGLSDIRHASRLAARPPTVLVPPIARPADPEAGPAPAADRLPGLSGGVPVVAAPMGVGCSIAVSSRSDGSKASTRNRPRGLGASYSEPSTSPCSMLPPSRACGANYCSPSSDSIAGGRPACHHIGHPQLRSTLGGATRPPQGGRLGPPPTAGTSHRNSRSGWSYPPWSCDSLG